MWNCIFIYRRHFRRWNYSIHEQKITSFALLLVLQTAQVEVKPHSSLLMTHHHWTWWRSETQMKGTHCSPDLKVYPWLAMQISTLTSVIWELIVHVFACVLSPHAEKPLSISDIYVIYPAVISSQVFNQYEWKQNNYDLSIAWVGVDAYTAEFFVALLS